MLSLKALLSVLAVLGPAQAIRYLGRVNPATKELSWSGTAVSFTFSGKSATINLASLSGENSAELIIDGKSTYIPTVSGKTITTPANLTSGNHTVIFRKSSEAQFGSIFIGAITVDGTFGPDIPILDRRIEVIGDSITSGYGIGGTLPCTNNAAQEIISETYSIKTAAELKADLSIISWSGIGVIRNYASGQVDTSPIMPERYTKYGANDASNSYPYPASLAPEAIVINLGTNDFGHNNVRPKLTGTEYTTAMVKFVQQIDSGYKNNATFFLLTSPMLNDGYPAGEMVKSTQRAALGEAVKQLGTKGVDSVLVDWPDQGSDLGCDYHPTPNTNDTGTGVLVKAIQGALGW